MPAPIGNSNRLSHGCHRFLTSGQLPKGCSYIRRQLNQLRTAIEARIVEKQGTVTITQAAVCQTALRHEAVCQLLLRYLRLADKGNGESLTFDQRLTALKTIANHSDRRDLCLKDLRLDASNEQSIYDVLYSDPPEPASGTGQDDPPADGPGIGTTCRPDGDNAPGDDSPLDALQAPSGDDLQAEPEAGQAENGGDAGAQGDK